MRNPFRKQPDYNPWRDRMFEITIPNLEAALECLNEANHHISEARKSTHLGERAEPVREAELQKQIRLRLDWALESLRRQERREM